MIKLTRAQQVILSLADQGLTAPQIAERLDVSPQWVYYVFQQERIRRGAPSRTTEYFDWPAAAILRLCQLYGLGWSASRIGADLRVSKNAVIGKCHRLGFPPRPSPIRRAPPADVPARSDGRPALPA